jgi:Mlc titration factor MtfA (ptsG expression regulator)
MGLFVSPYGATSIQEYFANGFEKYFLDSPQKVRDISPVLYSKIEEIVNAEA